MKKTIVLVMAFVMGLAFSAYAQVETTTKTTVKGDTAKQTTEVKTQNVKAKETITTKPGETVTKEEFKGKNVEASKTVTQTEGKVAGTTKFDVKKGAIEDLKIDWTYEMQGKDYVITYNVKEHSNPNLVKELGLTADQAKAIAPGKHTITSTSPYTALDVQHNFRKLIVEDIRTSMRK